jgi:hypothetical protein
MPEYRPDAPSVDVFTADELLVLSEWFGVGLSRCEELALWSRRVVRPSGRPHAEDENDEEDDEPLFPVDCILDEWGIPKEIPLMYSRSGVGVAQILLERVQDRLPQWGVWSPEDGVQLARPILDRRAQRKVELLPRLLFTINWADSGPGYSWPVSYYATYVPGFDRTVVTGSADCPDVFGFCDVALGSFGPEVSILEGSRRIIVSEWSSRRVEWDQRRWAYLFDTGLVSEADAQAWADEVWADREGDEDAAN